MSARLPDRLSAGVVDRLPTQWQRGARRVPLRAAVAALVIAGLMVVGATASSLGRSGAAAPIAVNRSPARSTGSPSRAPNSAGLSTPAGQPTNLVADVVGKVRHPGIVRLNAGARVVDAVAAAGGAASGAHLDEVNLAQLVTDGELITIPGAGMAAGGPVAGSGDGGRSGAGAAGGHPAGPVDLNSATAAELDTLPGVGPVTAGRIVDWRTAHGRFSTVEELGEVSGIGPKALARLLPLVRV